MRQLFELAGAYVPAQWRTDTSQPRVFTGADDPSTSPGVVLAAHDTWESTPRSIGIAPPPPGSRGAVTVGTSNYAIPASGVSYVATNGSDSNAGTIGSPFATVAHAIAVAPVSGTIVVRAGVYHESFQTPATANACTVQAYPGEAVWFDGSQQITTWTQAGSTWVHTGIPTKFYRSGTAGWTIPSGAVIGGDPTADLSDQVFFDGNRLQQVADGTTPLTGQFSVNYTANTITIADNPSGHEVRVSDLRSLIVATVPVSWKGVGVRRYSPDYTNAVPAPFYYGGNSGGSLFENVYVETSAICGFSINKPNCTIRNCTVANCTYSGIFSYQGDGIVIDSCVIRDINQGQFKTQPQSAGIKITNNVGPTVVNTLVTSSLPNALTNRANGIWTDVSCVQVTIARNSIVGNHSVGIAYEESAGGLLAGVQYRSAIAGNYIDGPRFGVYSQAAGDVDIYNNTIKNCSSIYLQVWQDRAGNTNNLYLPQSACPWQAVNVTVANNVFGPSAASIPSIRSNDTFGTQTADQLNTVLTNNAFMDNNGSLIQWGNAAQGYTNYNTVAAAQAAEPAHIAGNVQGSVADGQAAALPAGVAAALGVPTGTRKSGAYLTA